VPHKKLAEHVEPHEIPTGTESTVPAPLPDLETARAGVSVANAAETDRAGVIVTTQAPMPEHPPDKPAKTLSASAGVAVSVTWVPHKKLAEHVEPHEIPTGTESTVPAPLPDLETVRVGEIAGPVTLIVEGRPAATRSSVS